MKRLLPCVFALLCLGGGSAPAALAQAPVLTIVQPTAETYLLGPTELIADISPATIHVVDVTFVVDGQLICRVTSRPFKCPFDGGSRTDTSVHWDPAPQYSGPGAFLMPFFDPVVFYAPEVSGWLTVSGRIDDVAGAAEFDDTIRVLVAT